MMKVNKRFNSASFDNFRCSQPAQTKAVAALKNGVANGFVQNIIIIGGVGTGKTHLAYAVLNALAGRWKANSGNEYYRANNIYYTTAKEIIDNIKKSWKDPDLSNMETYCECPLLIIDEIGLQYGTASEKTELYEVFNRRYSDMLPIIAISNNTVEELQDILGQRIYDRLSEGALIFEFTGKSHRQERGQFEK